MKDFALDDLVFGICDPKLIKKIMEADIGPRAVSKES